MPPPGSTGLRYGAARSPVCPALRCAPVFPGLRRSPFFPAGSAAAAASAGAAAGGAVRRLPPARCRGALRRGVRRAYGARVVFGWCVSARSRFRRGLRGLCPGGLAGGRSAPRSASRDLFAVRRLRPPGGAPRAGPFGRPRARASLAGGSAAQAPRFGGVGPRLEFPAGAPAGGGPLFGACVVFAALGLWVSPLPPSRSPAPLGPGEARG